jgi:hypothetical protein
MQIESWCFDIDKRFQQELRAQQLPQKVSLNARPALVSIARHLLHKHTQMSIEQDGTPVALMSMEAYCTAFLRAFLEESEPPAQRILLYSMPEAELARYAKEHQIHLDFPSAKDDVRLMLDSIAAMQPQTYNALCRSASRLQPAAEFLRLAPK